jgi:hypothetical protein
MKIIMPRAKLHPHRKPQHTGESPLPSFLLHFIRFQASEQLFPFPVCLSHSLPLFPPCEAQGNCEFSINPSRPAAAVMTSLRSQADVLLGAMDKFQKDVSTPSTLSRNLAVLFSLSSTSRCAVLAIFQEMEIDLSLSCSPFPHLPSRSDFVERNCSPGRCGCLRMANSNPLLPLPSQGHLENQARRGSSAGEPHTGRVCRVEGVETSPTTG